MAVAGSHCRQYGYHGTEEKRSACVKINSCSSRLIRCIILTSRWTGRFVRFRDEVSECVTMSMLVTDGQVYNADITLGWLHTATTVTTATKERGQRV